MGRSPMLNGCRGTRQASPTNRSDGKWFTTWSSNAWALSAGDPYVRQVAGSVPCQTRPARKPQARPERGGRPLP